MNLFLLRHGLAVEPDTQGIHRDADRPITPEGERKLRKIAHALKALECSFDLILSSPYVRARQSAEIVAEVFNVGQPIPVSEDLAPGGDARRLIEELRRAEPAPESVLLVGHEPGLSLLIAWLVAGDRAVGLTLKKGGLCKLTAPALKPGRCASLEWLLTPKQMCRIA